jgi:superfamily II DNA/RNA helicase/peptidoglycan hydrolase-like protein with peptidoglycan-binding domain
MGPPVSANRPCNLADCYICFHVVQVTEGGHITIDMYPVQDVADMLGLTLDQMAMMGSLVENDFMKHATHLKEFHYRIGVLRHPMDTVVCVGKYLKEGGSDDPDDIFMAETDQTVRSAYSERLRQSVLQYNRPEINTHFNKRAADASAAIKALPKEENPDYPDNDLLRLLDGNGLHDAFRDGLLDPSVVQVLWTLHEMNAGRMPKKPISYRTPSSLNDWISRGKHPGVMLWPLRRRLVETLLHLGAADVSGLEFRDNLLGDRVICAVRPVDGALATGRDAIIDELQRSFFPDGSSPEVSKKVADVLGSASTLADTEFLHVASMFACVAAGCGSRYHYYSPLNKEDTLFFVKCVMISRVLMAGRTEGSDDALSSLALKVAKRLSPNDLCMTTVLSCLGMCLHHMDSLLNIRSLIAAKSGGTPATMDIKWLDGCDGRLVHAILQICLEARKEDKAFDPYDLATTEAQKAKVATIQALPWEDAFLLNWQGDVAAHVPASEKSSLAQMNDMQLDIWDRELVDPEGDAGDDDGAPQADDGDDEDPEDDGEHASSDEEAEAEADEEEQADNTTMEQDEWWMHGDGGEEDFESVTLAAPSDTKFIQLRMLLQEKDYASVKDWVTLLDEERWGDEVDAAQKEEAGKVTSIDEAYKSLEPPTIAEGGNDITTRMTTSMQVPRGAWRTHLGIKANDEDKEDELAEIEIDISRKWADIAESVPPMPRRERDDYKNGILTGVTISKGGPSTYKAESSWRPPIRRTRNNFQAEFKPEVFTFNGARDVKAEVGCKFSVTLTPHPNANTVKVAVYGSLDVTPLPPRTPAMVAKRNGDEEDSSGLAALSDMDRMRAKVDGIYDALIARAKCLRSKYAVSTNDRSNKKVEVWEDHVMTEYRAHQFQIDAFDLIRNGKSVVVTAPTGAGKTEVAMCAVNQALLNDERLIFICPTKALVNQTVLTILAYFQEYPDWQKKKPMDRLCGFNYMDEFGKVNTDAQIVVTVPQTLHLMLKSHQNKALEGVGWIVLDEVHHIQEGGGGASWDWIFRLLNRETCKFVGLSATLADNQVFAAWLNSFRGEVDFVYKPETYSKRIDPGSVAKTHGSHIEVFPNGRPVKQQIYLFDRDFTKLPRGSIIPVDDEYLPFNIALSASEDQKQLAHMRIEIKPAIVYDRQVMESIGDSALTTQTSEHSKSHAPGAPKESDEATPTKKWEGLKKAIAALVKRMFVKGADVVAEKANVLKRLTVCAPMLHSFLVSHMVAKPGPEMSARGAAAVEHVGLLIAGVFVLGDTKLGNELKGTHRMMWRSLVCHRAFKGMLARAMRKAMDFATVSTAFEYLLGLTLSTLEGGLNSVNSKYDEPLSRDPAWLEEDSDEEEETEPDLYAVDKTMSPLHLLQAMPVSQIRLTVKSVGDLLCETFVDVQSQVAVVVAAGEAALGGKKSSKAAVCYLCLDALSRFSDPPAALVDLSNNALTACVETVSVAPVAEAIVSGGARILDKLCSLLGLDTMPADAEAARKALFSKLLRLKQGKDRCIEHMLALCMYADNMGESEVTKIGKQLEALAALEDDDDEEEEMDDEEIINKAALILYRLLFCRTTTNLSDPAQIKVVTQQCVNDFLTLVMDVGTIETRELLIDAIRHSFGFMVGGQLITIGECKAMIYGLLPGLEQAWPVVGRKTVSSPPLVRSIQILFNAIPHVEGETLKVDGKFGKKTEARVKGLQKSQDMEVTGIVDEMTWICLVGPLPEGVKGLPVLALRELLPVVKAAGFLKADGTAAEPEPETELEDENDPRRTFDKPLSKELHRMCKAVGGWLILPTSVQEKEWNHLLLRSLYANWDCSTAAKEHNSGMRTRLKKAQIMFRAGLGISLVGDLKSRLLWLIKSAYEGQENKRPQFTGLQWQCTRYRLAKTFGVLDSDWEMNAFAVTLSPYRTFKVEMDKPKEKLPSPEDMAVELLSTRSEANSIFDRRAFEKLVYDIPERVKKDVAAEKQLLVALNIIGACSKDGEFVLPPHVVLTVVEVLHDFPGPTGSKTKKLVQAKCDSLRAEWSSMKINPYVLNTLEGEVAEIEKKLNPDKTQTAKATPDEDEIFVRNWLYSTKRMSVLWDHFAIVGKKGELRARKTFLRIIGVLAFITETGQQISRKVISEAYYLISLADRMMREDGVLASLDDEVLEAARALHGAWCRNKKINSQIRIFLAMTFVCAKGKVPPQQQTSEMVSYEECYTYLHYQMNEGLYDLRCLHMHEITGLQHYRELVLALREKKLLPALLFCLDRKKVEKIARHLAFQEGLMEVPDASKAAIEKVLPELAFSEPMGKSLGLFDMLRRGIGVHHADLSSQWRMEIEGLFRDKHLSIVVATSTLAVGIHMPCKTVVFCGDNAKHLSVAGFQQMAGRAGRQGIKMAASETVIKEPALENSSAFGAGEVSVAAEVGTVILFGGFTKERTEHLMTQPAHFEEQDFFDTGAVLSLIDLSNPRMEGTEGYQRGSAAISTRSAYEYLQLSKEAASVPEGVKFNPFDSNVARIKQQQLRAAFQNLRMMGMLDKNFEASLAVAVVQRMHLLSDPINLIFAQAVPFMAEHVVTLKTEKEKVEMILNMMLYFFPEPRPYTRMDDSLDWKPALKPLPPGVVNVVNMYNLENILNIMNLTKQPFDPPPNAQPLKAPSEEKKINEQGTKEEQEAAETTFDARIAARQLTVTPAVTDDEWYRPHPCAEALSGHCDNYIEAISYYTFVENSNGVKSVLARCGRENVYKTLMWEGPFKAHVPAFVVDELGSVDVCARLNLSIGDLYSDLNGLTNVSRKFVQALQDLWCMMPQVTADDGRKFERWVTFGGGTIHEETARWYVQELSQWLYDGMGAQNDFDSMNIFIKQFKEETDLKARRWYDSLAQSFWVFCAEGGGRAIRRTQKKAASTHSNARQLVDRYNMHRRGGHAAKGGVGRVKAYEKEVLQNLAMWLATGANYNSHIEMHDAFLASMTEEELLLIPKEMHALGLTFCKYMFEKRPRATKMYIINTKLTLAEAEATHHINLFSRTIW